MVFPLLTLATALSAPPEPKLEDGVQVALNASLSVPNSHSGYPHTDLSGGWGLYVGHLWSFPRRFKISFGIGFKHTPLNFASRDVNGNIFRWHPELRIGSGSDRVWGYGIISPGLAAMDLRSLSTFDLGFDLNLGVGISGAVWRGLTLGAELHFHFGHFGDEEPRFGDPIRKRFSTLSPTLVAGWLF